LDYVVFMPRKARVEYGGAVYHVMCRGNRQQAIFQDESDHQQFLTTLGEVCLRCGWRVHAYVLMGNHYHLLLETPGANLVAGMQWLQGTYTKRFNVRHKEWGHLFQGRYKALLVDGGAGDYFSTVGHYIHLNPARVKGFSFEDSALEEHVWSSYPAYLTLTKRPEWLCVDRVLRGLELDDSSAGRGQYRDYMRLRILEMQHSSKPWKIDAQWQVIRRGWCFGDPSFRKEMLDRLDRSLEFKQRESFSGEGVRTHDEVEAERLVTLGMQALSLSEDDLDCLIKSAPAKYAMAWLVRKNTSVRTRWIKDRLKMGSATNFANYLNRIETAGKDGWGAEAFQKIQVINL
jgi:REP element-mobilizing transposase RayT